MVHLEMSYLTHSKFSITMILDILPLFRARFRIFWWILYFEFSFARDLKLFFPFFAQGFGFFNKPILCPSVRARFRVLLKNDTSILFRPMFEADLWYFYPLPPEVRSWSLVYWYFYPPPLEVRSWSWFTDTSILLRSRFEADLWWWLVHFTGLTLEGQSNLVLFWSYTWKPVELGSIPVLHWKASQTCS